MTETGQPRVGFIGQGYIGKHYADDFEARGYACIRYALEEPYLANKEKIAECDIVFVAVPTPTTPAGFDDSIVREALTLVGEGKTAVIKSTLLPGTTKRLQTAFPGLIVLNSPEFLTEKTAAKDAAEPLRTIIGIPACDAAHKEAAERVRAILPEAPFEMIADATATELVKHAGNAFLFIKIVYANLIHDLAAPLGADYETVREAIAADPRIGPSHLRVTDSSGHPGATPGRGAGGHCLIKDFAALRLLAETTRQGPSTVALLRSFEEKNAELLRESGKDLDLLAAVYGAPA